MLVYVVISVRLAIQLSVGGKNFNITTFLDAMNMGNVKLCSIHRALPIHTTFSDLDCISRSQQCQKVLIENVIFLSN